MILSRYIYSNETSLPERHQRRRRRLVIHLPALSYTLCEPIDRAFPIAIHLFIGSILLAASRVFSPDNPQSQAKLFVFVLFRMRLVGFVFAATTTTNKPSSARGKAKQLAGLLQGSSVRGRRARSCSISNFFLGTSSSSFASSLGFFIAPRSLIASGATTNHR